MSRSRPLPPPAPPPEPRSGKGERLAAAGLGLLAVGLGVAFLVLDPARSVTSEAGWRLVRASGAVLAWTLACLGGGGALLKWRAPALLDGPMSGVDALVTGLAVWGMAGLALGLLGAFHPPGIAVLAALLSAGWLCRPRLRFPQVDGWTALAAGLVVLPGLVTALAPPVETDELYQHLAIPRLVLRTGALPGGLLHPNGSRPLALHLPYACLLATGGDSAPRLFHLLTAGLLVVGTAALTRDWLAPGGPKPGPDAGAVAALLLAGSYSFVHEGGLASNNLPAALAVLAALDAARRGQATGLAIAGGTAMAIKYTAAGPLGGIFLVAALPWPKRIAAGLAALAWVAPWWVRNLAHGLNPLFPYLGWPGDFHFQYLGKYGAGRDLKAMALLPWNAVMTARIDSFRFLGRLTPTFLAAAPAALGAMRHPGPARSVTAVAAVSLAAWAAGPQWLRHLLPALPVLALAAAGGLAPWLVGRTRALVSAGLGACWLAGLPANLGPVWRDAADRLDAARGTESRDVFLTRKLFDWPAIRWANQHLPPDARVALFFEWSTALLDRDSVLGSVEDHVPSRHWLLVHGDRSLDDLKAMGVTYVIRTRTRFLRKSYPFLNPATFDRTFQAPLDLLDRLLLHQATLIYRANRTEVWRL